MASPTLVSVVLPVYNGARYLPAAIASILDQTHRDLELIVIDDGSTDTSRSVAEGYAARDARVRVVSRGNRGLVATLNEGLELARAEFVARMDADDIAEPLRFERQVAYLEAHANCVALGTRVLLIDPDGDALMEMIDHREHAAIDQAHLAGGASQICHPSVMMRRSAVARVGGYRERYNTAEDLDLFLRLAEVGELANLAEPLLRYRQHLGSIGYEKAVLQWETAHAAIQDARQRRGMSMLAPRNIQHQARVAADEHHKWAWWALLGRNPRVARKHALRAIAAKPFDSGNVKLLFCALRGR